jgi:thiol:disulfide interchange protein DsbC
MRTIRSSRFFSVLLAAAAIVSTAVSSFAAVNFDLTADELAGVKSVYNSASISQKAKFQDARKTEIDGVYEIMLVGGQILYFYPATKLVLAGYLLNDDGINLTDQRADELKADIYSSIDTAPAVVIGDGPIEVIVFTDPDCPYCRKADRFFAEPEVAANVTLKVMFMPLSMHPNATNHVKYIYGAKDPREAMTEITDGKYDHIDIPDVDDVYDAQIAEVRKIARDSSVSSTPQFWIAGQYVKGADMRKIQSLVDAEVEKLGLNTVAEPSQLPEIAPVEMHVAPTAK